VEHRAEVHTQQLRTLERLTRTATECRLAAEYHFMAVGRSAPTRRHQEHPTRLDTDPGDLVRLDRTHLFAHVVDDTPRPIAQVQRNIVAVLTIEA